MGAYVIVQIFVRNGDFGLFLNGMSFRKESTAGLPQYVNVVYGHSRSESSSFLIRENLVTHCFCSHRTAELWNRGVSALYAVLAIPN